MSTWAVRPAACRDVAQVLAYAQVQGATEAVLVYPAPLRQPLDTWVNGIHVRTLAFALGGDLDVAGWELIGGLTAKPQRTQRGEEKRANSK